MQTIEQGRISSVSPSSFTVELFGRKGSWNVPLQKRGEFVFGEGGPEIHPPSLDGKEAVLEKGNNTVVAMDWESEFGRALCWASVPDAVVLKTI